jgi:hypothetical protein
VRDLRDQRKWWAYHWKSTSQLLPEPLVPAGCLCSAEVASGKLSPGAISVQTTLPRLLGGQVKAYVLLSQQPSA